MNGSDKQTLQRLECKESECSEYDFAEKDHSKKGTGEPG